MHIDSEGKFVRTDLWREGKWLDFWSVVHFFSGVAIGFLPRYLELNAFAAYAIALLLMISYEMFEALAKIEETPQNRMMDVVVGMASFIPAYYLNPFLPISWSIVLCVFFFFIVSISSFIGWRASKKAAAFEKRMREKIKESKEHFLLQRARRRIDRVKRKALREIKK